MTVTRTHLVAIAGLAIACSMPADAETKLRFWNLTASAITDLRLSPVGKGQWGPNQCLNDPDKTVDPDERLDLAGITPGHYDVKLTEKSGKRCLVPNVEVKGEGRFAFSIGEEDLKDCQP